MKSGDYAGLEELATICAMCNDSSVDYNEVCLCTVGLPDMYVQGMLTGSIFVYNWIT